MESEGGALVLPPLTSASSTSLVQRFPTKCSELLHSYHRGISSHEHISFCLSYLLMAMCSSRLSSKDNPQRCFLSQLTSPCLLTLGLATSTALPLCHVPGPFISLPTYTATNGRKPRSVIHSLCISSMVSSCFFNKRWSPPAGHSGCFGYGRGDAVQILGTVPR